ncbi:MAG: metal-dependent transcriptional regulator, partial [Chloroflexota bacterium]
SEKLEERIAAALNHPEFDPHGDPIPSKEGIVIDIASQPLSELPAGSRAIVSRVPDDADSELLRYLGELGLTPGTEFTVLEVAPFDGPITLDIGESTRIIGFRAAGAVLVRLEH